MNFRLEPHHLPPGSDAPLDAPADASYELNCNGRKRTISLRVVQLKKFAWFVLGRIEGEDDVWVVTQKTPARVEHPMLWRLPPRSLSKLQSIVRHASNGNNLWMAHLFFDVSLLGERVGALMNNRGGTWLDGDFQAVADFTFDSSKPLPENSFDAYCACLRTELAFSQSDVFETWHWAHSSQDERRARLFDGPLGLDALEQLLRLVLLSADELWSAHSEISWVFDWGQTEGHLLAQGWWVEVKDEAPRLQRWRRFVARRFWHPHLVRLGEHWWFREWMWKQRGQWNFKVEVARPSAHEQLEARLELRDWLRENTVHQQRRWLMPP